jgi:hypothetical protein
MWQVPARRSGAAGRGAPESVAAQETASVHSSQIGGVRSRSPRVLRVSPIGGNHGPGSLLGARAGRAWARRTRFQADHAARNSAEERQHLVASQPAAQNRRTLRIDAVNLKNMLG